MKKSIKKPSMRPHGVLATYIAELEKYIVELESRVGEMQRANDVLASGKTVKAKPRGAIRPVPQAFEQAEREQVTATEVPQKPTEVPDDLLE
jgi:hypothetical protein